MVDDQEMAEIRRRYVGKRGPTDVLSFPSDEAHAAHGELDRAENSNPSSMGDLIVNWDAVLRQAGSQDERALHEECLRLMIHGMAHLCGHDHRGNRDSRCMHRLELRAMRAARVSDMPRPYVRRTLLQVYG